MNNVLQVKDLVILNDKMEKVKIDGRQLHMFLDIKTPYTIWFDRMCEYGFVESIDYVTKMLDRSDGKAGKPLTTHELTLDMAKELAMLQHNEKGQQARRYFIEIEKDWNSPEKVMSRALLMAERQINDLTKQLEANKPKVLFADAVTASETSILIGELAKLIKQNGVDIGGKRLFAWMRKNGYLTLSNLPTQKAMNLDLFEVIERLIIMPDGTVVTKTTTKVKGKGQVYFLNKFLKNKNIA